MIRLWVDIETYSSVDLKKYGVYAYAESPDFKILMTAWSVDGINVQLALGDEWTEIPGLFDPDVVKIAHNAQFERICFSYADDQKAGGSYWPASEWIDTAATAGIAGYSQQLGRLAVELGADPKDEAGTRLINMFCKPNRKKERTLPEEKPEEWESFKNYCIQDVYTLIDVHKRLPEMPEFERRVWLADQAINDRGIRIDRELATMAVQADQSNRAKYEAELRELLGIENAASVIQIQGALNSQGLDIADLRADTVRQALTTDLEPSHRRALQLRQELALVASRKYETALGSVCADDRLRGSFRYCGAHTGRWSGRGVQLQNLPKLSFTRRNPETGKEEWDQTGQDLAILDTKLGLGVDSTTLKKMVRSMLLGPFTVVDYSAIEARVLAWLAGESWVLDAFRNHRDIYVETANRMSTETNPLSRQQGKVAVLALGYNGGIESLRSMGAEGTDDFLVGMVRKWRRANPRITRLWQTTEYAFCNGGTAGRLEFRKVGSDRELVLPSGRTITYHAVRSGNNPSFRDPRGHRVGTYGGRLVENATQAVSRDLLAHALVLLEGRGYTTVGHVHDEVIVEGSNVSGVEKIVIQQPGWAKGLPLAAEGFTCDRYRKG